MRPISKGHYMRILLLLFLTSCPAMALDRCLIEAVPNGNSTCFLVANNATFTCAGQDQKRTPHCKTPTGEVVACELRPTKLREPPDIWCEMPTPAPSENAVVTVMAGGERFRSVGQSETTKPTAQPSTNAETCRVPPDHGGLSYAREFEFYVRCLKRKAVVDGRIPLEDCSSYVTYQPHSLGYSGQLRRKEDCLDRQAIKRSLEIGQIRP